MSRVSRSGVGLPWMSRSTWCCFTLFDAAIASGLRSIEIHEPMEDAEAKKDRTDGLWCETWRNDRAWLRNEECLLAKRDRRCPAHTETDSSPSTAPSWHQ